MKRIYYKSFIYQTALMNSLEHYNMYFLQIFLSYSKLIKMRTKNCSSNRLIQRNSQSTECIIFLKRRTRLCWINSKFLSINHRMETVISNCDQQKLLAPCKQHQ